MLAAVIRRRFFKKYSLTMVSFLFVNFFLFGCVFSLSLSGVLRNETREGGLRKGFVDEALKRRL